MQRDAFDVLISEIDKKKQELEEQKEVIKKTQRLMQNLTPKCENCIHFRQHYILDRDFKHPELLVFQKIFIGHCTYGRIKNKNRDDVCQNFEPKQKEDYEGKRCFYCPL